MHALRNRANSYLISAKARAWIRPLSRLLECFRHHQIPVFLDAGSLLAAIRDEQLFPHLDDEDVDLSLVVDLKVLDALCFAFSDIRKMEQTLVAWQTAFGMHVRMNTLVPYPRRLGLLTLYVLHRTMLRPANVPLGDKWWKCIARFWRDTGQLIVNVTFFRESQDVYWSAGYKTYLRKAYGSPPVDYIARTVPKALFLELDESNVLGLEVLIPHSPHRRLEHRYGSDWRTPRVEWNYWLQSGEVDSEFATSSEFHFVPE